MTVRGQSHVVGVTILLGLTVVSLGTLTAGVGTVVEHNAASADAARVASDLDDALEPVETTGPDRGRVAFTDGRLSTADRQLRVLDRSGVVHAVDVGALIYRAGDRRVAFVAGALVRGAGGILVVGAPRLNAGHATVDGGGGGTTVRLRTNVSHERVALGTGTYRVAIETDTPDALARAFRDRNRSVARRDFDGDGIGSVVVAFPGERTAYLVVHDMRLEVTRG